MMDLKNRIADAEAILFDLFHTLVSFINIPGTPTNEILGIPEDEWNHQVFNSSEERLRGQVKDRVEIVGTLARRINPLLDEETVIRAANSRFSRFRVCLENPNPQTLSVLKSLKQNGKKIGLVSNADCAEVVSWHESPLASIFDCAIFSCHVGYVKPEREIYQKCLERLDVSANRSVFVGDGGDNELKGAKGVGMTTVVTTEVIRYIWPERIENIQKDADFVIEALKELDVNHR